MKKIFLLFIIFIAAISCSNKTENNENAAMPNETQLTSNTLTFEGDFVYYADSAIFSNYADMKNYPVVK